MKQLADMSDELERSRVGLWKIFKQVKRRSYVLHDVSNYENSLAYAWLYDPVFFGKSESYDNDNLSVNVYFRISIWIGAIVFPKSHIAMLHDDLQHSRFTKAINSFMYHIASLFQKMGPSFLHKKWSRHYLKKKSCHMILEKSLRQKYQEKWLLRAFSTSNTGGGQYVTIILKPLSLQQNYLF